MTVRQAYEIHDPDFMSAVGGAPAGWRTKLDKLEAEVARVRDAPGGVAHATFTLERVYAATPAQAFHAMVDPEARERWFAGGDG